MAKRSGKVTKKKHARLVVKRPRAASGSPDSQLAFKGFLARDTSPAKKIQLIRGGVAARVVEDMVDYFHVSKSEIFRILRTPESTAHKLIKDGRPLDAGASERVVRVADVTRMAEDTFGGREAATQWLKTPNFALDTATPLSVLDTEPGALEVRRILSAINHGGVF
jgi:putative toxin-antitoxin system antitoxin component (TIGR02293 family)